MNYVYVVVALVLIGGGYYLFSAPAKDANVMSDTGTPVDNSDETMTEHDEMDMTDDEITLEADATITIADADAEIQTFEVKGVNFAYDVKEIRVKEGDTVTINFESSDGFHDWVVDEFGAATSKVKPGTPTSVTFKADKAGTYEYYCSVGSHRASGMVGTLIVE